MKTTYVKDLLRSRRREGSEVELLCWVKARRDQGGIVFLDLCDSTGQIQAVAKSKEDSESEQATGSVSLAIKKQHANVVQQKAYSVAKTLSVESSVRAVGLIRSGLNGVEIHLSTLEVIGHAQANFSPRPRSSINVVDEKMADHLLKNRHLYLRNEKVAAILRFRHRMMGAIHEWFRHKGFIEITAPILTATPLYEDRSALSLEVNGENIFLTQCVGFYLESAVHAFERVYNIGPSFRAEETRSKRHLMEYWHIKGELAWVNLEDLFLVVEDLIRSVSVFCADECGDLEKVLGTELCVDGVLAPFPRISYVDAVQRLKHLGVPFEFGTSMGSLEEEALSKQFASPFWITGIPRKIEPFPYVIDRNDPRVTMTADLIASNGYGELLGIAEKTADLNEIDERMKEKGKYGDERYAWVRQLREFGCVPHGGFGIGIERLIRWLLDIPHVRDAIPFPRTFGRKVLP